MRGDIQAGETFGVYLFSEPRACSGMQRVGVGTVAAGNPPSTTIAAPGLTTVEVLTTKPNRTFCSVRWSFEAVPGKRYLVAGGTTPTGCSARVLDVTDPSKIVPESSMRRRDVASNACVPMAQTSTLADITSRARATSESELPIPTAPAPGSKGAAVTEDDLGGLTGK